MIRDEMRGGSDCIASFGGIYCAHERLLPRKRTLQLSKRQHPRADTADILGEMKLTPKEKYAQDLRGREAGPSAGGAAGQYQAVACNRQADFRGFYLSAKLRCQGRVYHISEHRRL